MSKITEIEINEAAEKLEKATAQQVVQWAANRFGSKLALASSFGAEDVALIDIIAKIDKNAKVFTLDMTNAIEGGKEVAVKASDKEICLVVAAVPEFFKGNQTYSYQVSIDRK